MPIIDTYKGFNIEHTPNTRGYYDINLSQSKSTNQRSYVTFNSLKKAKDAIDNNFQYTNPNGTKFVK